MKDILNGYGLGVYKSTNLQYVRFTNNQPAAICLNVTLDYIYIYRERERE